MNNLNIIISKTNNTHIYSKNDIGKDNILNDEQIKRINSKVGFEKLRSNFILKKIVLFAIMALCMTLIELLGGIILLKCFNLRLWDYSNEKFNYKGFICLKFSLFWMLISAVYYFLIHPEVQESIEWLSRNLIFSFVVGAIIGVYVVDIIYSANVVGKIKKLVNDKKLVIKLEEIKEKFSREKQKSEAKAAFFAFMLRENIENIIHPSKKEEK